MESNQRSRLLGAMVAVVAERGYEATNVSHVVALSGVSRTAFYRLFANKEECFVAAVDGIVRYASASVTRAWRGGGSWDERLRAAFDTFVAEVVSQPAASKMCLIDVYAAGDIAIERANQALAMFERMVETSFAESPERVDVPPLVARAIVGGIHQVMMTRVRRGETEQLPEIIPDLWRWATAYTGPATPLVSRKVAAQPSKASQLTTGDLNERVCLAVAETIAKRGYAATTLDDIVAHASISLTTFYDRFGTKEDAFLAAYDVGITRAARATFEAYQEEGDWRTGLRSFSEAMLRHLAADSIWTRLGVLEAFAVGPRAMERRDAAIQAFAFVLKPAFESRPDMPEIANEATAGGVYALIYDHVRTQGTERLLELQPVMTFFALAPFLGAEEAASIANQPLPQGQLESAH